MIKEENGKKIIDILDKVLSSKYWDIGYESIHYTGHQYYRSPYESDDNCGTCNGARCDYCKKNVDNPNLIFFIYSDILYNILLEDAVPEDIAKEFSYSDTCTNRYKNYIFIWPNDDMLKERYPDMYNEILKEVNNGKDN